MTSMRIRRKATKNFIPADFLRFSLVPVTISFFANDHYNIFLDYNMLFIPHCHHCHLE